MEEESVCIHVLNKQIIEQVCETVLAVEEICHETGNDWFLTHTFTHLSLGDLKLQNFFKQRDYSNFFHVGECICSTGTCDDCWRCELEIWRMELFADMKLDNTDFWSCCYDFDTDRWTRSKWIFADKIDGKIPGFMLIKCTGGRFEDEKFTHELNFACVRPEFRRRGILRNMVSQLPKEWSIWLEAGSFDIPRVEKIWKKCGFSFHKNDVLGRVFYKKLPSGQAAN